MMNAAQQTDQRHRNIEAVAAMGEELSSDGLFSLGYWLQSLKEYDKAAECYQKVLKQVPDCYEAFYNLGVISYQTSALTKAEDFFRKAIACKPDLAEALSALGVIKCEQKRFEEAMVCIDQALAIYPDLAATHYHKGLVLQQMGSYEQGLQSIQKALVCDPGFAPARWLNLLSLPVQYETAEQINRYRQRFTDNLTHLVESVGLETPRQRQYALDGISTCTNFYLQYQGGNDLELQKQYGRFVHRIMAANFPQWVQSRAMSVLQPGEKIRIGYVSSCMFAHTIGVFLSGWIENHNSSDFEIHCYHMGHKIDALTTHIQKHSHTFHRFDGDVQAAAHRIATDQLHILVYTDVGMYTETMQLAALRLAPIQCKGWGHPVTTGLPTMDFYLSSDLMEPENADQFYSERLIRLPNLALCYRRPELPVNPKPRAQLGIPADKFVYLSTQSLYKYLPQYDDIYPLIAKKVTNACFVFIGHQSSFATGQFKERLEKAFRKHKLNADQFCYFSHRLKSDDFLSLNMSADALLDTFDWSGGKTTLEAISCGLPVVTCPGRFMRARHAYAMLKMIGLTETIASDKSDYCRIAVNLGKDPGFYSTVRRKLLKHRNKLYDDPIFIKGLETFFKSMVQQNMRRG